MSENAKADDIPVLWFDRRGHGPAEFDLRLHSFAAEQGIPATLGIRVLASDGGLVIGDATALIEGGFMMDRENAASLYRGIGAWLAESNAEQP